MQAQNDIGTDSPEKTYNGTHRFESRLIAQLDATVERRTADLNPSHPTWFSLAGDNQT